jgi:hypothetical protein
MQQITKLRSFIMEEKAANAHYIGSSELVGGAKVNDHKPGEVVLAINDLTMAKDNLIKEVTALVERLQPVLSPSSEGQKGETDHAAQFRTEHANRISFIGNDIRMVTDIVRQVSKLLEI